MIYYVIMYVYVIIYVNITYSIICYHIIFGVFVIMNNMYWVLGSYDDYVVDLATLQS